MNGPELTQESPALVGRGSAGRPWLRLARGPGGAPGWGSGSGLFRGGQPNWLVLQNLLLTEGGPQEGGRSLVCLQGGKPGPAASPVCEVLGVQGGERVLFSESCPLAPCPGHCEPQQGCPGVTLEAVTAGILPPLCPPLCPAPSVRSAGWRPWSHRPPIQEPRCSFPGGLCPGAWGQQPCPPSWVPRGLVLGPGSRAVCGSQSCRVVSQPGNLEA